jgi:hypothetical protein
MHSAGKKRYAAAAIREGNVEAAAAGTVRVRIRRMPMQVASDNPLVLTRTLIPGPAVRAARQVCAAVRAQRSG